MSDYEEMSENGIAALTGSVTGPHAERITPLDDLGSHPLHLLANALAFDHFCHLRNDILRPNGPIDRPAPPDDELRVGAVVEWLIAVLPQMSRAAVWDALDRPVALRLSGAGGGAWTFRRGDDDSIDVIDGVTGEAAAVTTPATEFVIWGTRRRPWRDRDVTVEGDI